jgi:hypothetical protein
MVAGSEWGETTWVTLMKLSEGADEYYSTVEDALQEATDAQEEYIASLKDTSLTIDKWLDDLAISDLAPVQSAAEWSRQYEEAKAKASAATATEADVSDYLNFATKYLGFEKSYGTKGSYQAIYDAVTGDVAAMGGAKDTLLSVAQQQLTALKSIVDNTAVLAAIPLASGVAGPVVEAALSPAAADVQAAAEAVVNQIFPLSSVRPVATALGQAGVTPVEVPTAQYELNTVMLQIAQSIQASFGNAQGNAFSMGNVVPFSNGGIYNAPTIFPMADGMGLLGEAGPEAIMPLKRGRDGKLGVSMDNVVSIDDARAERESIIHNHIYIDGKEIQYVVTKGMKTNADLIASTRRAVA